MAGSGAAGLVNAVLRNATRESVPPLEAGVELSHPSALLHRLELLVGAEASLQIARHNNSEPPTIVRLFNGRSTDEMVEPDVEIIPHEDARMFVVKGAKQSHFARCAEAGIAQVQDPTAARVAAACEVRAGDAVLDRCAGRGTKTLQLLDYVGPAGHVVAMDASEPRCADLKRLAESARARPSDGQAWRMDGGQCRPL